MKRIAIVEDHQDVARGIGRAIERHPDLQVAGTYLNAESALEEIPGSRTNIVLMDIGLPKMNGIECMVRLRAQKPDLDFIMFTIFDADEQLFEALRYGASGYILKADGIIGAIRALRELIDGGAPMSREVAKRVLTSFSTPFLREIGIEELTPKQNEVLHLLAEGLYNKEIADRLGITEGTVKQYCHAIYRKLHVANRVEAVNKYLNR